MLHAVFYAIVAVALYGIYLFIVGLVKLWRYHQKQMFWWTFAAFMFTGILFFLSLTIKYDDLNIWIALIAALAGIFWICMGYLMEAYLRKERQRLEAGQPRTIPQRPPHCMRNNFIILLLSLLVLAYGAFIGNFGGNVPFERIMLCLSLFFLASSCSKIWKYRNF